MLGWIILGILVLWVVAGIAYLSCIVTHGVYRRTDDDTPLWDYIITFRVIFPIGLVFVISEMFKRSKVR